jgi:protoporphyrinogen oxidase
MATKKNIVIIGGGPSGLSVAWGLSNEPDLKVHIIEIGNRVGGLSKTLSHDSIKFDIGPHRLSPQLPNIVKRVKELLGDDLVEKPNHHGVYYNNILYSYPPKLSDFANISSLKSSLVFGSSWLWARLADSVNIFQSKAKREHRPFEDRLRAYFGNRFCDTVVFPMVRKVWGDCDLHSEFARIRFELPTFLSLLKKVFFNKYELNDNIFYYPTHGFSQIWDTLAEHLKEKGSKIELGARINQIETDSLKGPFKVTFQQGDVSKRIDADIIVSTISNKFLMDYLEPTGLMKPVAHLKKSYPSRTLRLGIVEVKDFKLKQRVIIFPEPKHIFNRIAEMNQFADLGYAKGHSILMVDVINDNGDELDSMSDSEFNAALLKSLSTLGWWKESQVERIFSRRFPGAYPILSPERYEAQEDIEEFFANSGIILCGREASSDYNNAHNAIGKGFIAADYITGAIDYGEYKKTSKTIGRLPIQD